MKEQIIYAGTAYGRRILIKLLDPEVPSELAPSIASGWYCGYVECLPDDWYYNAHEEEAELDFDVYGGVTWEGMIPNIPEINNFYALGFDTNHFPDRSWTISELRSECTKLSRQLWETDGKRLKGQSF